MRNLYRILRVLVAYLPALLSVTACSVSATAPDSTDLSPPPLSEQQERLITTKLRLLRNHDCTYVPGAFYKDGDCFNPLFFYVDTTIDEPALWDSLQAKSKNEALYAWGEFSGPRTPASNKYHLSYSEFRSLLEDEVPKEKFPAWIGPAVWLTEWIRKNVWLPLYRNFIRPILDRIRAPIADLRLAWKILILVLFSVIVLAGSIFASQFMSRLYPPSEHGLAANLKADGEIDRLSEARSFAEQGNMAAAVESLYRWLIAHTHRRRLVRRYEWWTNGQLIAAIARKHPEQESFVREVVSRYEEASYGHKALPEETIAHLLREASVKGRRG